MENKHFNDTARGVLLCTLLAVVFVAAFALAENAFRIRELKKSVAEQTLKLKQQETALTTYAWLYQSEVRLNDEIERRFPNGLPPEDAAEEVKISAEIDD
jgi:type II secretory pathway component PulK